MEGSPDRGPYSSASRLTRVYVLLGAVRWLPIGLILPFLILTPSARGISIAAIGAIFAVHSAVAIALEVPSGVLADTLGRRRVMIAGAALTAVSLVVFAFAVSFAAFVCAVALLATGRALISGSLEAWYVDRLRLLDPLAPLAEGLSRGTAAEGIAMAIGSLAGGGLVALAGAASGPLPVYGVAAVAAAAAAIVYLALVAALVHEDPPAAAAADRMPGVGERLRQVVAGARREAAASLTVRIVFFTGAAFGLSLTAVELLWQPRLAELAGPGTTGFAFGALSAASMAAVAVGAALSPALGRRFGVVGGYVGASAIAAGCIALLGAFELPLAFAAIYLLTYLSFGAAEPIHAQLLNDAVGPTSRATLISAEAMATQGGSLVANLGIGALAAAQGAAAAWVVAGVLLLAAIAAIARPLRRSLARAV